MPLEEDPREAPERETVPLVRPEEEPDRVLTPLERPEAVLELEDRELTPREFTPILEGFCRLFLLITGFPDRVSQLKPYPQ